MNHQHRPPDRTQDDTTVNFADCVERYMLDSFTSWEDGRLGVPTSYQRGWQRDVLRVFGRSMAHGRPYVFSQVWLLSSLWVSAGAVSSILYSIFRAWTYRLTPDQWKK
jgi:hypothetical protein